MVGVDTRLDDELVTEGRVYDLIHSVQRLRRDAGLEVTDRIVLTIPKEDETLLGHRDWIAEGDACRGRAGRRRAGGAQGG